MVDTYKDEFAELAKIYVTNVGYPSIHVYTVDDGLMNFIRVKYGARIVPHIGTYDVVISKRQNISLAAADIASRRSGAERSPVITLLRYCTSEKKEQRDRLVARLKRQLKVLNDRS